MCLAWPVGWSGSLDRRLREVIGTGIQSVRDCDAAALGTVALLLALFLWYCYQVGREQPQPPPQPRPYCGPLPASKALLLLPGAAAAAAAAEEEEGVPPNGCYYAPCPSGPGGGGGGGVLHQRLYRHLQEYAKRYSWSGMGRIHKAIREQGRRPRRPRPPSIQRPEVFLLPDLPSAPYFAREAQRHDVELLERNFQTIAGEFEALYQAFPSGGGGVTAGGQPSPPPPPPPPGWKTHRTPAGQWLTFPLVRQGACLPRNCRRCPRTFRLLGSLRTCIGNNVFGNAGLSLLMPGTVVAEHYGPTNIRLRCHLGLKTPSNCELVVGGEPQCWAEGRCLLFDDSFLHTAFHGGPPEEGPHAVFMVDLWHPNVAAAERQALDFIFAPGR